jgi:hypothetical protein
VTAESLTPQEEDGLRKAHKDFAQKQEAKREAVKVDDRREQADKN